MQMDAGLDTGAMLLAETVEIAAADTTGTLQGRLAQLGGELIGRSRAFAEGGRPPACAQPEAGASPTRPKEIVKAEATIDWSEPAAVIERRLPPTLRRARAAPRTARR